MNLKPEIDPISSSFLIERSPHNKSVRLSAASPAKISRLK
jgi:hypothetical protein